MSLSAFTLPVFVSGVVALAAGLWLLHRLRVRHREVTLPTILFWSFAVERSRARALDRRFRHPLAYLFILALLALLWTLAADPRREDHESGEHHVVIDASAAMAGGGRLAAAIERAGDMLSTTGGNAYVYAAAAVPSMLYRPGESSTHFRIRTDGMMADLCPSTVVSVLESIRARTGGARRAAVTVITAEELDVRTSASLADSLDLRTIIVPCAESARNRAGIVALGAAAADASPVGEARALVVVRRFDGVGTPPEIEVRFDGVAAMPTSVTAADASTWHFEFDDGVAEGASIVARLVEADAFPADDSGSGRVPRSPSCPLRIVGEIPDKVMAAIDADPAITRDPAAPLVLGSADAVDSDAPSAIVVDADPSATDVTIEAADDRVFERISEVFAAAPTLEIVRRSVEGGRVRVRVARRSFEGDGVFSSGDLTAIVFFRLLHLIGRASVAPGWIASGRDVDAHGVTKAASHGRMLPIIDGRLRPLRTGSHQFDGVETDVSLLDADASVVAGSSKGEGRIVARGGTAHVASWIALACAILLCVEWFLVRSGRMP